MLTLGVRPSLGILDVPERLRDLACHLDVEDLFLVVVLNQGAPECDESVHLGDELRFEVLRVPAQGDFPLDDRALIFNLAVSQLAPIFFQELLACALLGRNQT